MAIRIEGGGNRRETPRSAPIDSGVGVGRVRQADSSQFGSTLGHTFQQAQEEHLQQMAMEVEAQGKKLAGRVDIAELKAYKRMVAEFLEEAVSGYGKFSKESFLDRRGRHRVYATVKTINEKMEALTQEVLKSEKDNLAIAGRIEDIRGLVLDMLL